MSKKFLIGMLVSIVVLILCIVLLFYVQENKTIDVIGKISSNYIDMGNIPIFNDIQDSTNIIETVNMLDNEEIITENKDVEVLTETNIEEKQINEVKQTSPKTETKITLTKEEKQEDTGNSVSNLKTTTELKIYNLKKINEEIQNDSTNEVKEETKKIFEKTQETTENTRVDTQENSTKETKEEITQDVKTIAKQKMLNSITYPQEDTYIQMGIVERKFNYSEAMRVASDIIDESFKYGYLWDGTNLKYKMQFVYKKSIMEDSMYWPYRSTAIISGTRNMNTNGTFYIWAEDFYNNGELLYTRYCIR